MTSSIIFFGTSNFAAIILKKMLAEKLLVIAVVTQPDRPSGRTQQLKPSPVKSQALASGLTLFQPEKLDSAFAEELGRLNSDLIIVAAYGKIIPQNILNIPHFKAINVHPSLLPKYRGASPVSSVILAGDTVTGVTIMLMDAKMDHGPVLSQENTNISDTDTNESLHQRLAEQGGNLLIKTIPDWLAGRIKPQEQNHSQASFTKILNRDDGRINWQDSAVKICQQIRAFYPWPMAWSIIKDSSKPKILNKKLIIHQAIPIKSDSIIKPGEINFGKKLTIGTGDGSIVVEKLQLEGAKPISESDFRHGYQSTIVLN